MTKIRTGHFITSNALKHEVYDKDHQKGPSEGGRGEVLEDGCGMEELGQGADVLVVHVGRGKQVLEVGGQPHRRGVDLGRGGGNVPHQVLDKLYALLLVAT